MKTSTARPGEPSWGEDWSLGLRLWVERGGHAILGKGRLELLQTIEQTHSISAAARHMGMSYRRAWELVQSINQAAGQPLVTAATGGVHGGGAELTPLGRWAIETFQRMHEQITRTAATVLPQIIQRPDSPSLHIVAAVSLQDVLGQLLIDYALQQPLVNVRTVFGASDELVDHILAGIPADLFLTADASTLDQLEQAGLVEPRSSVLLAGNSLAAIGRADQAALPKSLGPLLRKKDLRIALAQPDCPLGSYTRAHLDDDATYENLVRRAVLVDNSRAVVTAVQAGQADVGLVYASDALRASGCRLLFRLERSGAPIQYQAVLIRRKQDLGPARTLLEFLTSADAARRLRACGFTTVKGRRT